ncbi:MAG: T9SS type A sorting domain-containing protein [Saprospiraceae bacterium]|nr:T9SS type A sorting domain-containing protein [Saprospiraceae bacterium]
MKKNLLSPIYMLCLLICFVANQALAQQNQKIVFPTPAGFQTSTGLSISLAADGGYLLTGQSEFTDWNTVGIDMRPRVIKLDAGLNVAWDNLYVPPPQGSGGLCFPEGSALELPDGDWIMGLHNDSTDIHLLRLNADGSLDYQKPVPGFQRSARVLDILSNGNFLVYSDGNNDAIKHLDPAGNEVFSVNISLQGIQDPPVLLANGDLLFRKFNSTQLTRLTNTGTQVWQIQPASGFGQFFALPNGGFGTCAYIQASNKWHIRFYDDNGVETSVTPDLPIPTNLTGVRPFADGTLLAYGSTATNRGYLMRFDTDGNLIWSAESPVDAQLPLINMNGIPEPDGWAAGVGTTSGTEMGFMKVSANTGLFQNTVSGAVRHDTDESCTAEAGEPGLYHTRVQATNGLETFSTFSDGEGNYTLILPAGDFTITAEPNEHFFFLCPTAANTVSFPANANGDAVVDLPIQSLELIHQLKGRVTLDQNNDCLADPTEPSLSEWDMQLDYNGGYIHWKTDANGEYSLFLPSGDYTLELSPLNQNFAICGAAVRNISLAGADPLVQTEDYLAYAALNCPEMRLDIGNNTVRPCSTRTIVVGYQNLGAADADDQTLEVTLDPMLTYEGGEPVPDVIDGNTLTYELGDIAPGSPSDWSNIKIYTLADCDLQIGQQVCISAELLDYSPCMHPASWQGAIVKVEGECDTDSDSIYFKIKNVGNGPNAGPLEFVIAEDQIVLFQGTFQLVAGAEDIYGVLPMFDSTTVSIEAEQEPGAPGDTIVTYSLTNCLGMGGGSPSGLGGSAGPAATSRCLPVVNSYDPNDKTALPLGFGPQHLVHPGTPLEYTIRFQNTGNDTAFTVILRDTLSELLDRSRIELLGSSHAYTFAQLNDSILHVRFDNILLPDSSTNPEASQGYFSFRIYPKPELPNGTVVHNRAAIYFDQNPPIITNTVTRVYGEYLLVSTDEVTDPARVKVEVMPNPFMSQAQFVLPSDLPEAARSLEVFDASGKLVQRLHFRQNHCTIYREQLSSGLYFWHISENGKTLASGRIVAEGGR